MVRFSVFYPSSDDSTFDHDYYRDKHVPLVVKTWGVSRVEIAKGINGPYVAAVHLFFDSMESMAGAMGVEGTGDIIADVANYTTITPVQQIAEIVD